MWRNFDLLYQRILMATDRAKEKSSKEDSKENDAGMVLQEILDLPALARVVKGEGTYAIQEYMNKHKVQISKSAQAKIHKHFARVQVMGYIIRSALTSCVFPVVLRDLRDGLERGVKYGDREQEGSVAMFLRTRLSFNSDREKMVLKAMDPSVEDRATRDMLETKKAKLVNLKSDFTRCQQQLSQLVANMQSKS
jgi:hypothetical protein